MAKIENLIRLFKSSSETMEYAADLAAIITQNFERIVPRIALVNHDVHAQFDRKIEAKKAAAKV